MFRSFLLFTSTGGWFCDFNCFLAGVKREDGGVFGE